MDEILARLPEWTAVAEGFCPYGHGQLEIAEVHEGRLSGYCLECGCSWYVKDGVLWGSACVPADHSCGAVLGLAPQ
jgi:hypothetical protein